MNCLRPMTADDLECVLGWRNHDEVRRWMYTQEPISLEDHISWFDRVSRKPGQHLLVFERSHEPAGFVNLNVVAGGRIAEWGFYAAPEAPKGTGRLLGHAALRYAFTDAGASKVCGQVIGDNERSIRFHLNLGFRQEGVLRNQHFDGQTYHDVVCFGLLSTEWEANL